MIPITPIASLSTIRDFEDHASTLTLEMLLHDLSAPVRHIEFFVEQLKDSVKDPTPDQAAWIRRIEENLYTQRTLLQDSRLLLSYERHPKVDWNQPIRVNAMIADVASSFRSDFDKKGLDLVLDLGDDLDVIVDPKALGRVVANLLGNALKATPRGGIITIGSRPEGDTMMFRVSDTGGGFTHEQAATLSRGWEDFDRGVNPPGIWGGLGLLICHSLVLEHGGHLSLESPGAGQGSTFSFGIRLAPRVHGPADNERSSNGPARSA